MAKSIIKAGISDKYFCAAAMVFKEEGKPEKYQGLLLCREKGKEFAKYAALEVGISSRNKGVVLEQMHKIAKLYPPKADIVIVDTEGLIEQ